MVNKVFKMDDIDRNILNLVQQRPELTHREIAQKVNRSQPTIGIRIKKLEAQGVLKYQAGINLRVANFNYANVQIETSNPKAILGIVKTCPYMISGFRLSGTTNVIILIAAMKLKDLDRIVNHHFRNNPEVLNVYMNIITEISGDFVLPVDLDFDKCNCPLKIK